MPYTIAIHDWSQFTMPAALTVSDIETNSHANDPAHVDYDSARPTWIGENYTFNGGAATDIAVSDDDALFEDGYVETGGA